MLPTCSLSATVSVVPLDSCTLIEAGADSTPVISKRAPTTVLPSGTVSEALSISTVLVDVVSVAELDCAALDDVEPVGVDRDDVACVGGAVSVRDPLDLVGVALGVDDGPGLVELDESCDELAVALAPR